MSSRNKTIKTGLGATVPFYDVYVGDDGRVSFRIDNQRFWLSHEPKEVEELEGINGHGKKNSEWIAKQVRVALDKMALNYENIETGVQ